MTAYSARRRRLLALLIALCALLAGCKSTDATRAVALTLDGKAWAGGAFSSESGDALRVYVTLDGALLADLPFGEAHTLQVVQPDGAENEIALTGEAVYMKSANCENHDCVDMGEVTRDNLELRVLGGFIVCLPHRLSVEVRGE